MNKEVRLRLKACDTPFRSGDAWAYSSSWANLKKGIQKARHSHKLRIEEHSKNSSVPRRMWQGIQAITSAPSSDAPLPDELNHFDRNNKEVAIKAVLPADHQPLTHSPTDVCVALSRVNAWKAAGLDGVPGGVLRACAVQLTEVWTDIFNLSLAREAVPVGFRTTSIVQGPKHSPAVSLNDYRTHPHHHKVL